VFKGKIHNSNFKQRNSRLEEFYHVSVILLVNYMMCDLNMHDFSLLYDEFCVSGKFPETAWRAIHSR